MITESEMYWITRCDYLHLGAFAVGLAGTILSAIWFVVSNVVRASASVPEDQSLARKHLCGSTILLVVFIVVALGSAFVPTTKEMYAIKIVPLIANNERIQDIPNDVMNLTKEWIEEFRPKK